MSDPLLRIHNHHPGGCGDPPIIHSDDPNLYIGYFENTFGEQWIFTFDRNTGRGALRGGDAGWNHVFEVEDGTVPHLQLNAAEAVWLEACWDAATRALPLTKK